MRMRSRERSLYRIVPPGVYDVQCSAHGEHRYRQMVRHDTVQRAVCGICRAPAAFRKLSARKEVVHE